MRILGPGSSLSSPKYAGGIYASSARSAPEEGGDRLELSTGLNQLGAAQNARKQLGEVVQSLRQGKPFPHQSYLIVGDSGTGTTTLATRLAEDLSGYGITTFITSGGEVLKQGHQGLIGLFEQARSTAGQNPTKQAVIFIDDVDTAFPPRLNQVDSASIAQHQLLGVFLDEAGQLAGQDGSQILLLGTTNRPDTMDWSARDRFQQHVTVNTPSNAEERLQVLESLLAQKGLVAEHPQALREMAEGSRGSNPLQLSRMLDAAQAVTPDDGILSSADLQLARLEARYGPVSVRPVPDWAFRLTACHELAHVVVRQFFQSMARPDEVPLAVDMISLIPREGTDAAVELKYNGNPSKTLEYYVAEIASNYAGRSAEVLFGDGHLSAGVGNDVEHLTRLAREAVLEKGMGASLGGLQPAASGVDQAYQLRAQADIDRLLKTSEHLSLTLTRYYGDFIEELADEFVAGRQQLERLLMSGQQFSERLRAWEEACPQRQAELGKLREYVRQQLNGLRPAPATAWDPTTGAQVPVFGPRV